MKKKAELDQALARRAPRQERALHKLELIFEAATRLLEQQEPSDISTNAIARLAGISIGTLYQYFPDKNAIFQAMTQRELSGLSERILSVMKSPPARRGGRVASLLSAVLDAYGGRKIAHRRLMQHSLERGSTGLLGQLLEKLVSSFSEQGVVGPGITIPPLSRVDAFVLAHAVGGVLRGVIGLQSAKALDREELEQSLTRLILTFATPASQLLR